MGQRAKRAVVVPLIGAAMLLGAPGGAGAAIVTPADHDFGNHPIGSTSPAHAFSVFVACQVPDPGDSTFCIGSDFLTTTAMNVTGPFVIQSESCPDVHSALLASGSFCLVNVAFRPTAPGPATGSLNTGTIGTLAGPTAQLRGGGVIGPGGPGGGALQADQASNSFSFGAVKLNGENGTATLTVDVPGPGNVALGGKGVVKQRSAPSALASKVTAKAGKVKLKVKAKGNKKGKLNHAGKVKVKAKVTFTPTGGVSASKTKKITLKKSL